MIAADATVGQVNSALESIGASIAGMRTGVPAITVAVPRQDDGAALQAIADTLGAQPGIRMVLLPKVPTVQVAPPAPANTQESLGYLQLTKFPAAWNARAAASTACSSERVTVIVVDKFHRPIDALYAEFLAQVAGVTDLGTGTVAAGALEGFHGYDVLTTLAAKLDATSPTGANPFPECMDIKAIQLQGLTAHQISLDIAAVLVDTAGKVVVNASYSFQEACGDQATGELCTPDKLDTDTAVARAVRGALERALLKPFEDRVLVISAAGNQADDPIASVYPGAGLAGVSSSFNVAATADSPMSFVTDTALWEPSSPCSIPPCFPSLAATPGDVQTLNAFISDLGLTFAPKAANVMIVGSIDSNFLPSGFSEPGADVFAVGEGIPTLIGVPTLGTSFSAPQVAALASYLWMLSPELRARPVLDTIGAIKANADSDGIINAYATILSLDEPVPVTPTSARVRLAILDVDDDGDFDLPDLQAFHAAYVDAGVPRQPSAQDHGRFDLNGDGFTGGSRATRMDIDPTGSARFGARLLSEVTVEIAGTERKLNEIAITDARALCFYANSALYSGDGTARDTLMGSLCDEVTVAVEPGSVVLVPGAMRQFVASVAGTANADVSWSATGGTITADGLFTAGATTGSFRVKATSVADTDAFAEAEVTIAAGSTTRTVSGGQIEVAIDAIGCRDLRRSPAGETQWTDSLSCDATGGSSGEANVTMQFRETFAGTRITGVTATGSSSVAVAASEQNGVATSAYFLFFSLAQPAQVIIDAELNGVSSNNTLSLRGPATSIFKRDNGPFNQTVVLGPGSYELLIDAGAVVNLDSGTGRANAGFRLNLSFSP